MRLNKIRCHSLVIFTVSSLSNVSTEQLQQPYRAKHVLSLSAVLRISSVEGSPGNPKIPFHPAFDKGRKRDGGFDEPCSGNLSLCSSCPICKYEGHRASISHSKLLDCVIPAWSAGIRPTWMSPDGSCESGCRPCRHDKVFHFCFLRASVD